MQSHITGATVTVHKQYKAGVLCKFCYLRVQKASITLSVQSHHTNILILTIVYMDQTKYV